MEFINKGSFSDAYLELKNDKNNAVSEILNIKKDNIQNGILKNVVFTIKDNYAKKSAKTEASSDILKNFETKYNSTILNLLLDQGAHLLASTNLDELALGGLGIYSNKGIITNKLDKKRISAGSSSGSVATFTKNIGFAIGSDTGDSVRLPAAFAGDIGFKPSYGAVSRYGLFAYASSLDTVAWFAHNINDTYLLAKTLYKQDELDMTSVDIKLKELRKTKPKKVAYLDCSNFIDEEINEKYNKLLKKLKDDGVELIKIQPNIEILDNIKVVYEIISFAEASSNLSNLNGISFGQREYGENWNDIIRNTRSKNLGFMVQRRIALGSYYLEKQNQEEIFIRAQKVRRIINDWFTKIHNENDIFIYPSSKDIAPLIKDIDISKNNNFMDHILTGANLVGNPSLSIKLGTKDEMPFSITIDSEIYQDSKLLNVSLYIEEILKEI